MFGLLFSVGLRATNTEQSRTNTHNYQKSDYERALQNQYKVHDGTLGQMARPSCQRRQAISQLALLQERIISQRQQRPGRSRLLLNFALACRHRRFNREIRAGARQSWLIA
jgi:hypothetical protein